MWKQKLSQKRFASLSRKLRKNGLPDLIDIRTRGITSLSKIYALRSEKEIKLLTELKAYSELESIGAFNESELDILIEKSGITSLAKLTSRSTTALYQILKENWGDVAKDDAMHRIEEIKATAQEIKSGRQLAKQIPGLGKTNAAALVEAGIFSARDLSQATVSSLWSLSVIQKANLSEDRLRSYKTKANMISAALVPTQFVDALHDLEIKTLQQLSLAAECNSRAIRRKNSDLQPASAEQVSGRTEKFSSHAQGAY